MDRTTFDFVLWGPPDTAPENEDNRHFRASYFTEWRMSGKSLSDHLDRLTPIRRAECDRRLRQVEASRT